MTIKTWTDTPTYRPYQLRRLHIQFELPPGMHVFGSPVPDGYTALNIAIDIAMDVRVS